MKRESRAHRLQVVRVLKQYAPDEPAAWSITCIGQGYQAWLFSAQRGRDLANSSERSVLVKLYKDAAAADRQAFLRESNGLRILSETLPKSLDNGWTIQSPVWLYASDDPLALVMSLVPGVSLDVWLRSNAPAAEEIESIVVALLASMQTLWSQRFLYGDLNLKNILYDPAKRSLGLIDPGMPAEYYRCAGVTTQFWPMSRDVAYLLFSVAVSVRSTLRSPAARERQQLVVSSFLRRYVESLEPGRPQTMFLNELQSCLETHLHELQGSWSPSGMWRHMVKQVAKGSLSRTLEKLTVEHPEVPS